MEQKHLVFLLLMAGEGLDMLEFLSTLRAYVLIPLPLPMDPGHVPLQTFCFHVLSVVDVTLKCFKFGFVYCATLSNVCSLRTF